MRPLILAVLFVGLFGMGAELLLFQHTGSVWELIPLVLIGLALVILTRHAITEHPASVRAVQGIMGLFLIAGVAGIALHYQSSMEIQARNQRVSKWLGAVLGCNVCENTAGPGTGRHDSAGTARACIHLPTSGQ